MKTVKNINREEAARQGMGLQSYRRELQLLATKYEPNLQKKAIRMRMAGKDSIAVYEFLKDAGAYCGAAGLKLPAASEGSYRNLQGISILKVRT